MSDVYVVIGHTGGAVENPYDPNCQVDYTGTEYVVEALPFSPMEPPR